MNEFNEKIKEECGKLKYELSAKEYEDKLWAGLKYEKENCLEYIDSIKENLDKVKHEIRDLKLIERIMQKTLRREKLKRKYIKRKYDHMEGGGSVLMANAAVKLQKNFLKKVVSDLTKILDEIPECETGDCASFRDFDMRAGCHTPLSEKLKESKCCEKQNEENENEYK